MTDVLIIDNYDSFTYNLYQYVALLGRQPVVVRNDVVSIEEITAMNCQAIVISPGPGTPDEAGISKDVIRHFTGKIPILGVCLGHQAIGEVFGGKVVRAPEPVHGKISLIRHNGQGMYQRVANPLPVGRYHSLVVAKEDLPDCLEITAFTEDGLIMGLKHKQHALEGVQFHPESVLTSQGMELLGNFFAGI
ncbi:Para-aminobenzoate synthase glutamine amidotransferase component II [Propionispora sp. 2/2-37]|uniref:anthranilate synthase component II n=1 Tax=Propionispora sp. 2/2-37 TaxID=1677858 RepID=UPI0006BB627C|nr:aminodeoxychorismate/anthranilate synthase component II [Propionispora sp. 2/2-37]CUH96986.1 Para-aminobenzoate synthase glutamine amidotransferase component II [Propionispora sp. 2/2-37]